MKISTVYDLFKRELFHIYNAEKQIIKNFSRIADKTTHQDLEDSLRHHINESKEHVSRLEEVFRILHLNAENIECEAMQGLLSEVNQITSEIKEGDLLDMALITAVQKIEHHEIGSYGSLCAMAKGLGHDEAAKILHKTLEEEKSIDKELSKLAKKTVNQDALKKAA